MKQTIKHAIKFLLVTLITCSNLSAMNPRLGNLPREVIGEICEYLPGREVATNVAFTNRHLCDAVFGKNGYFTRTDNCHPFKIVITPEKLNDKAFCSWAKNIKRPLAITVTKRYVQSSYRKKNISNFLNELQNVVELIFDFSTIKDKYDGHLIFENLPLFLEKLTLILNDSSLDKISFRQLTKLKILTIKSTEEYKNCYLPNELWKNLPQSLEKLELEKCWFDRRKKCDGSVLETMKRLKKIIFCATRVPKKIFASLPQSIESVDLCVSCNLKSLKKIKSLCKLANLVELNVLEERMRLCLEDPHNFIKHFPKQLKSLHFPDSVDSMILENLSVFKRFTKLEKLSFPIRKTYSEEDFLAFKNLPLKELSLQGGWRESRTTGEFLRSLPQSLKKLYLYRCENITGAGLQNLVNLESLSASICPKLTVQAMGDLRKLPLKTVRFYYCPKLSDKIHSILPPVVENVSFDRCGVKQANVENE